MEKKESNCTLGPNLLLVAQFLHCTSAPTGETRMSVAQRARFRRPAGERDPAKHHVRAPFLPVTPTCGTHSVVLLAPTKQTGHLAALGGPHADLPSERCIPPRPRRWQVARKQLPSRAAWTNSPRSRAEISPANRTCRPSLATAL